MGRDRQKLLAAGSQGSIFYDSYSPALRGASGGNVLHIPPTVKAEGVYGRVAGCSSGLLEIRA